MDNYFIRNKLAEQILSINNVDLQVWLDTTQTYLEDYFKKYSTQAMNFSSLISDYKIMRIGDEDGVKSNSFYIIKKRAMEYLVLYIKYIEEKEKLTQSDLIIEEPKNQNMTKHVKTFEEFTENEKTIQKDPKQDEQVLTKKRKFPFNLTQELFWSGFSAIILGTFFLGFYIGQTKFDKEKIDYYNQLNELKKDTTVLNHQIKILKTEKNKSIK